MIPPSYSSGHDTVSALAYALAQAHARPDRAESQPPYNDLTAFLLQQMSALPDYLRVPMRAATLGFDLFGCLRSGRPFHSQPALARQQQIAAWKKSRLSFQRDLIRYYESLALLALYSRRQPGSAGTAKPSSQAIPAENLKQVLSAPAGELFTQVVVIGSGPGGAITACLLAEAGRDVLLIEEGPFLSLESCSPFSQEEMLQKYRNGGQTVTLGRNKVAYVEGRCAGGGSEINSGLYHRTPGDILERWRKDFQVEALTDADLRPHFEACERDVSVSPLPGPAPAASLKLHEGAQRLGWKSLEVPRWFRYEAQGTGGGTRQSMTQTFLPRFLRAGGKLLPETRIERIRQDGDRWLTQGRNRDCGNVTIRAESVFVCGGAVQTPALLRRSGITVNVGNSLRLHPTLKVVARFDQAVNSANMGVPVHQVKEFAPRFSFGCSISTMAYLALGLVDYPEAARQVGDTWPHLANYYAMIAGEGQGSVRSIPGFRDPLVRYRLTLSDRRVLAEALQKLSRLLFEAGATELYPSLAGGLPLRSRDDLNRLPDILPDGMASLMTIHLFSSCPMGEDKRKCATDSFGRVHGFKGLRVGDASLLCTAPGVNPQGSIMALARRNALHFLGC